MLTRRGLIRGAIGLLVAPAIVRVSSLMPVKSIEHWGIIEEFGDGWYRASIPDGLMENTTYYLRGNGDTSFKLCTTPIDGNTMHIKIVRA